MQFIDTHCHIHFEDYGLNADEVISAANQEGVVGFLCVGTTLEDSKDGVFFVKNRKNTWATIGIHPHEAHHYFQNPDLLENMILLVDQPKVVAIGECGLDYYYNHSPKEAQKEIFRFQLDLAKKHNMPMIFHVRDAFDDFFDLYDQFSGIRGVVHSFTANKSVLDKITTRGLYVGLNGITTFSRDESQLRAAKAVPLQKLLLETDAPFLTPKPFRGTICQPKHVRVTAEFLSKLREESLQDIADFTTQNAKELFNLK